MRVSSAGVGSSCLLALVVCLLLQPLVVTASHFAYGTISWQLTPSPAYPNRYVVNFECAFRRDYGSFNPWNPSVGQTFTGSDVGSVIVAQTVNSGPCCGLP
jgi:hypothetical protein